MPGSESESGPMGVIALPADVKKGARAPVENSDILNTGAGTPVKWSLSLSCLPWSATS